MDGECAGVLIQGRKKKKKSAILISNSAREVWGAGWERRRDSGRPGSSAQAHVHPQIPRPWLLRGLPVPGGAAGRAVTGGRASGLAMTLFSASNAPADPSAGQAARLRLPLRTLLRRG
jgi:hypothetical protein